MIEQAEQLTTILTIVLIVMIVILVVLVLIYLIFKLKSKKSKKEEEDISINTETTTQTNNTAYNKQSIFNFMEFDNIMDDMIIQKNEKRFLMVTEYQGVNYDLMSEMEKTAVEEGFLQFLNTLRHPIQLYIQTRTVNLESSIQNYKERMKKTEMKLDQMQREYNQKVGSSAYTPKQLERSFYDLVKQKNLCEYGRDIIYNTERMNLNKNVLNKKYYIIVSYYPEELGNNKFDKDEIRSIAFSELYTKSQSMIRTLSACGINGKILDSNELVDLLYTAYNRDEAEVYGVDRATRAGYDELFSTAPDVLEKKIKQLNKEIEKRAIEEANNRILHATEKEMEINQMVKNMDSLILEEVKELLEKNKSYIGEDTTDIALEDLEKDIKKQEGKIKKGADKNVQKEKKTTTKRKAI